jgi:enoyl-CoA hydratase/carnithine racemase
MELKCLRWHLSGNIGRITLDRPPVNAISRQMLDELNAVLDTLAEPIASGTLRVLVIDAEGRHFCAGADLKERQSIPDDQVEEAVSRIRDTFQRIYDLPVPVIAAVHGSALGGGLELALAADLRVLTTDAKVGLPETGLAIIPGAGGTQRLPRLIGPAKALYWIASAKIFSGLEAFEAGVAEFLVKPDELHDFVRDLAEQIAQNGPVAVRAAKAAIRRGWNLDIRQALEVEKEEYRRTIFTEDRREGLRAFLEKRKPNYTGR